MGSVGAVPTSLATAALNQPPATSLLLWISISMRLRKPQPSKDWRLWFVFHLLSYRLHLIKGQWYCTPWRSWGRSLERNAFIPSWNADYINSWGQSAFCLSLYPSSSTEPGTWVWIGLSCDEMDFAFALSMYSLDRMCLLSFCLYHPHNTITHERKRRICLPFTTVILCLAQCLARSRDLIDPC